VLWFNLLGAGCAERSIRATNSAAAQADGLPHPYEALRALAGIDSWHSTNGCTASVPGALSNRGLHRFCFSSQL